MGCEREYLEPSGVDFCKTHQRNYMRCLEERNGKLEQEVAALKNALSKFTDGNSGHDLHDFGRQCKYHTIIGVPHEWPCPVAEAQRLVSGKPRCEHKNWRSPFGPVGIRECKDCGERFSESAAPAQCLCASIMAGRLGCDCPIHPREPSSGSGAGGHPDMSQNGTVPS